MNTCTRRTELAKQSTVVLALWVSIFQKRFPDVNLRVTKAKYSLHIVHKIKQSNNKSKCFNLKDLKKKKES